MASTTTRLLDEMQAAGKLPTPPGVLLRLLEVCRSSNASAKQLADTISLDPGLSAKILRFVNSPLAGLRSKVSSLQQAVSLMGVRSVKMMALSFSAVSREGRSFCKGFDHERYALQSLGCAAAARCLSEQSQVSTPESSFLGGLLSQIGRSIFASGCPGEYADVLSRASAIPADLPPLETAALGESYAALGGQVLRVWGLPDEVCSAVEVFRNDEGEAGLPALSKILRAAEIAACAICPTKQADPADFDRFVDCCDRYFHLTREQCAAVLGTTVKEVDAARAMLDIPPEKLRAVGEIENEIRERIAELSIAMHLENQTMALQQADLLRRATTDALTGVGNRAAFDARWSLELERAARTKTPVALLIIDIDKFKSINDTHGHLAGDQVLRAVARILDDNVRKVDYCARYGGEEFAVIAPSTPYEGVLNVAERLRNSVEAAVCNYETKTIHVTISIGVALAENIGDPAEAGREIIRTADKFLYEAKVGGRNRVVAGHWPSK